MRALPLVLLCLVPAVVRATESPAAAPATHAASSAAPKWQLAVETGADGTKSITATLPADAPIRSGFGEVTPKLTVRYRSGRTSAYVLFDTFLGSGTTEVVIETGSATPQTEKWRISNDGRSVFVPGDALPFIEKLKQADVLHVSVTPKRGERITAHFSPREIDQVIKALISAGVKYSG
jgi:hypothetical protein